MSPTYSTPFQVIDAAEQHGWTVRPIITPDGPWSMYKEGVRIQIKERPDGGIAWCVLGRNLTTRYDNAKLDSRHAGKLEIVLAWLAGDFEAHRRATLFKPVA